MNEKTLQELKDSLVAMMQKAKDCPDQLEQLTPSLMSFIVIGIVETARQLTRLADQGDDTAKARDHSVEQMMSALAGSPDDALVEAVKLIARDQAGKYMIKMGKGDRDEQWIKGKIGYKILMKEALEIALAAHKKAVR